MRYIIQSPHKTAIFLHIIIDFFLGVVQMHIISGYSKGIC